MVDQKVLVIDFQEKAIKHLQVHVVQISFEQRFDLSVGEVITEVVLSNLLANESNDRYVDFIDGDGENYPNEQI